MNMYSVTVSTKPAKHGGSDAMSTTGRDDVPGVTQ